MVQSQEQLLPMMGWVDTVPMPVVRLIGVLEVLGALGLILPALTGIAPVLSVAAAVGLALIQVGGTYTHVTRGEADQIGLNLTLLAIAALAAGLGTVWLSDAGAAVTLGRLDAE